MPKLNLGCGLDWRPGYVNVDLKRHPGLTGERFDKYDVLEQDLSKLPWPWSDASVEEILMLDFLEHFPYAQTRWILEECWRVLKPGGVVEIQVPDFEHCSAAANQAEDGYLCNKCGNQINLRYGSQEFGGVNEDAWACSKCGEKLDAISQAAIYRLYGGQDVEGNWHYNAFTKPLLISHLARSGFCDVEWLQYNQNGETFEQNWNMKARAIKQEDPWTSA